MTTHVSPVETAAGPVERPRRQRERRPKSGTLGLIGLVVVLGAWQICVSLGVVDGRFTSSPVGAVGGLVEMIRTGDLWLPLLSTLSSVLYGMVITIVVGIPLGLLIGRSQALFDLTEPLVSIMYAVPFVVFLPIVIFWFGIGAEARLVIVVWSAIFPLVINVIAGARNIETNYLHVARVFCASRLLTLRVIAFPATLPFILAGVRQAVGRALVGAIVAELFMGNSGLGYVVQTQTSNFQMDDAMAAIVVIAVLAVVLTRGVAWLERRFTFWSSSV
jgi:ABC-type nitrate/sulfonate/bicarbonate transport system permease component